MAINMHKSKKSKKDKIWHYSIIFLFFLLVIGFVMLWAYFPSVLQWFDKFNTPVEIPYRPASDIVFEPGDRQTIAQKIGEKYGTYGDSYGALNTLFSGLAFAFLILSLYLQGNEIRDQQKEIRHSNKIAKQQRKITKQQAKLLKQQIKDAKHQHFNQILFNLLEEKNRRIQSMKYKDFDGIEILKVFANFFLDTIENINFEDMNETNKINYIDFILNETFQYYWSKNDDLGSPFERSLYVNYIIDLIYYIEENSAKEYISESIQILRMYMSHDEIMCIAWLATIYPALEKLVNKYGLLANFRGDEYPSAEISLQLIFSKEAFEIY
ncbi:hypothetical protein FY048_18750 [Acinetobacter sp. 1124_18A]|uniref:hypothetical protein n=1 Tax=Acinetobacter sp. 1124_18A TaxID=2605958 RepID=UPI004059E94D